MLKLASFKRKCQEGHNFLTFLSVCETLPSDQVKTTLVSHEGLKETSVSFKRSCLVTDQDTFIFSFQLCLKFLLNLVESFKIPNRKHTKELNAAY